MICHGDISRVVCSVALFSSIFKDHRSYICPRQNPTLVTWFQYMSNISSHYGYLDLLYIFSHFGDHGPLCIFIMDILIYVYCTWLWPHMWYHVSCLFMAIVLLCIQDCYMYLQSCMIVLCWLGGWSSIWDPSSLHFWDGLIMYFGHRIIPLTSHIRGHLL